MIKFLPYGVPLRPLEVLNALEFDANLGHAVAALPRSATVRLLGLLLGPVVLVPLALDLGPELVQLGL